MWHAAADAPYWDPQSHGGIPQWACFGHTFNAVGEDKMTLVAFGGTSGRAFLVWDDLLLYDVARGTWTSPRLAGAAPGPRYRHSACSVPGPHTRQLLIWGGYSSAGNEQPFADVHVLDVETQMWSTPKCTGDPMPGLAQHTATIVGQRLYVFGGMALSQDDDGMSYNKYQQDVMVLDTDRMLCTICFWVVSRPCAMCSTVRLPAIGRLFGP